MEPNLNLNQLLKKIKQNEKKMKSTYTREFGTYIGRFRPRSNGISGSVSRTFIYYKIVYARNRVEFKKLAIYSFIFI